MRRIGTVCDWDDEIEVHVNYHYVTLMVTHRRETVAIELSKDKVEQLIKLLDEGVTKR